MKEKYFNGKNLQALREAAFLPDYRLANNLGIATPTIRRYESGGMPLSSNLRKLEEYFCVPAGFFEKPGTLTDEQVLDIIRHMRMEHRAAYEDAIRKGNADSKKEVYPYRLYRVVFGRDYKPEVLTSEQENGLAEALRTMNSREQKVLLLRYCMRMTLKEAGKELGITGERVRQIEAKSIHKMRHPLRAWLMRDGVTEAGKKLIAEEANVHFGKEAGKDFVFAAQEYIVPELRIDILHETSDGAKDAETQYYNENGTWVETCVYEKEGCLPWLDIAGGSGVYVLELTENQYEDFQKLPSNAIITTLKGKAVYKLDIDIVEIYPGK